MIDYLAAMADIQYAAMALAGLLFLVWITYKSSRHPSRKKASRSIYSCGMGYEPDEMGVSQEGYYDYMRRFLRADLIGRLHSGRLSTYTSWIMIGTAMILAAALILW
jgi:hypothetical protein